MPSTKTPSKQFNGSNVRDALSWGGKRMKRGNLVKQNVTQKKKNWNKCFSHVYLPCFSFSVWISINPHECRTLTIIIVANKMVAMKLKKCAQLRKAMALPWWWWCALLPFVIAAALSRLLPLLFTNFVPCCDFILSRKIECVCFDHLCICVCKCVFFVVVCFCILCSIFCAPTVVCLFTLRLFTLQFFGANVD